MIRGITASELLTTAVHDPVDLKRFGPAVLTAPRQENVP